MMSDVDITPRAFRTAFDAGYTARFSGRPRRAGYDDEDLALAWTCGWDAADRKIYADWGR